MSAIGFLVLLVIAIIALMLLMTKVKLNPVMSLFVVALGFGVTLGIFGTEGYSFMETLTLITTGFGNTLGSLGMPIILGAVLAMGVQDTGAAKSIANFFIRLFRGKNLELAPSLTAYVVSIPVFGDITTILCSNIANVLGKRKHISMSTMASFTQTGLNLTHAMVPPTPGILAVSVALSADLGMVISWGIVITVITFFLTWLILKRWTAKEWIPAVPAVTAEIKETSSDEVSDLIIKDKDLPNTFASFLTILIPVILIAGGYDKHIPYEPLAPEVVAHVKNLVLMGATGPRIEKAVREDPNFNEAELPIQHADNMQHAVELARACAKPGDIIILSPASASFDLYPNFEVRGREFKKIVNELK